MAWLVQNCGWMMVEPGLKAGHHTQAEAVRCAKPSRETTASTSWPCLWNLFPVLETLLGPIEPGTGGSSWAPYSGSSKQCLLNPWVLRGIQQRCHKSQQFKDRRGAYLPERWSFPEMLHVVKQGSDHHHQSLIYLIVTKFKNQDMKGRKGASSCDRADV